MPAKTAARRSAKTAETKAPDKSKTGDKSPTMSSSKMEPSDTAPRWTFLTNHSHVLVLIHSDPDVVLREVALEVGITERAVQRIIQDLEAGGFIERERVGRRNRYSVLVDQPLRHPIESHRNIGDLLNLVSHDDE